MADEPRHVRITADGVMGKVEIDGADISRSIRGYELQHQVGGPPVLVLHTVPHRGLDFEGLAHVAVAPPKQDEGELVAAFLQNVDAAALERAALARDDLDDSRHELTVAMLQQLADWAQGRT
ncbi:hypothetical protein [Streptomyces sp. sk2.1]|uniref:hypothetical protein n=1 Tax=Streptomyces sp. sk2.1 TaxID=2478959 RepID=UPI0011E65A62|nr:hypothetical protein [Streptomyces sp. sk2.1]TXS68940.1 hypothetical protein EAO76_26605 [Streptomyces sp. sk2.1]